MNRSVSQIILSAALVSLLIAVSLFNGAFSAPQAPVQTIQVVTVNEAIMLTENQKVTLFIDELMTKKQASCLKWILNKESNTNSKAKNPKSSAKGMGQLLDSTYKNIGLKHSADPLAQVVATIAYISRHYGSGGSCSAKAFWLKHSYY
jgi:hypothetical protein